MTSTTWHVVLCIITALAALSSIMLIEVAKTRKHRWWEQAANWDPATPDAASNKAFNPATALLRTNDLAHYASWPAVFGAATGIAAIAIASNLGQILAATALTLITIGVASYAHIMGQQVVKPSQSPGTSGN